MKPGDKKKLETWQWLYDSIKARPTKSRNLGPDEFALTTKVTAGPRKGSNFKLSNSPYIIEPLQLSGPSSPIQQIIFMASAQTGKSVFGQLVTTYYGKEVPSEIIYVAPDEKRGRMTMERRIEPAFHSAGIGFRSHSENRRSKRTGDLVMSKLFDGGNLDMATSNSPASMSQETKRIGIFDETDRAKQNLGDEGTPWGIFYARMQAWGSRKKALGLSTPKDIDTSLIYSLFQTGDEREYYVPCPLCGKLQQLKIKDVSGYGLTWESKNDIVTESSVVYVCRHCAKSFKELKKYEIIQTGKDGDAIWKSKSVASNPYIASFHISALYSMFKGWYEIATEFVESRDDISKKKDFENFVMGLPFKQVGSRPKATTVIENKGDYLSGTVPDGVIYISSGIDVQRGANKWRDTSDEKLDIAIDEAVKDNTAHKMKFPRLEAEWIGKGAGYRTWAINYKVFYGRVEDAFAGAWEKLNDYRVQLEQENGRYGFKRMSDNWVFPVVQTLLDSGYKPETGDEGNPHVVYMFCGRWNATHPSKGFKLLKKNKIEQRKQTDRYDHIRYRWAKVDSGTTTLCEFSGNHYKQRIYNSLKIQRSEDDIQRPGFQDFPRDYPNRFFEGLTAEEKLIDGNYDNAGRWNDPLDIHVMAECAADVYLDKFTEIERARKKDTGNFSQLQIKEAISHKFSILKLSKMAGIDKRYNETPVKRA